MDDRGWPPGGCPRSLEATEGHMRLITVSTIGCGLLYAMALGVPDRTAGAQVVMRRPRVPLEAGAPVLSAEQLLSVSSVVGGRDEPVWAPDGSQISFLGSF